MENCNFLGHSNPIDIFQKNIVIVNRIRIFDQFAGVQDKDGISKTVTIE